MIEKVFKKTYNCGSRMQISFTEIGGPIIVKEIVMDSQHKEEIEKEEQLFYLKKFNPDILNTLIQKNFKEVSY